MISDFVITNDNEKIFYNYYSNNRSFLVIIVPGWFMTKDSKPFWELSEILYNFYDILTFDCRGHGHSSGSYTFTVNEIMDIRAIVENFKKKYEKIYLLGFSLGAALSLIYSAKYKDISKVIAISPPTDFDKIENNILSINAWLPTIKKCELKTWFSIRADIRNLLFVKKIKPIDIISEVKCPTLFLAGAKDPIIRIWHTQNLYNSSLSDKKLIVYTEGLHAEDLFIQYKDKFISDCVNWFE